MIRISFTESDNIFITPGVYSVRWMPAEKHMKHKDICNLTGICGNSYLLDYVAGGIERLKAVNFYRPRNNLSQHWAAV